jgi:hypothetical protein
MTKFRVWFAAQIDPCVDIERLAGSNAFAAKGAKVATEEGIFTAENAESAEKSEAQTGAACELLLHNGCFPDLGLPLERVP